MEQTLNLETFLTRLEELPEDLKEAILTVGFLDRLKRVQKVSLLHIDQAGILEDLVFKVILGDIKSEDFPQIVATSMYLSNDEATALATTIDQEVLQPIREEFKSIREETEDLEETEDEAAEETPEDPSNLKAEDILAEVENPQPSVGILHETIIPQKVLAPIAPPIPVTPKITPLPTGWPVPQKTVAVQNPTPTATIAATLNQKLEQPTVSKPVEIKHSIDPYKEAVE